MAQEEPISARRSPGRLGTLVTALLAGIAGGLIAPLILPGLRRNVRPATKNIFKTGIALYESGRESIAMSIPEANAFNIGALIALYERAVGFYGSLVNINAYDQPGVEVGKKAATRLLELQKQVRANLTGGPGKTAEEIARSIDADPEDVFHVLRHLANNDPRIRMLRGEEPVDDQFSHAG